MKDEGCFLSVKMDRENEQGGGSKQERANRVREGGKRKVEGGKESDWRMTGWSLNEEQRPHDSMGTR